MATTTASTSGKSTNLMSNTTLSWPVKGGGVLWPNEMTDGQLRQALAHGLNLAAKHFHDLGMDELGSAAGGDGGMEYLAEVQSEAHFAKAFDRKELYQYLATLPRYVALMREARGRVYAQRTIEKAAGRHIPR